MNNSQDYTVAYCVCDKGKMVEELITSLKSIEQFIDRKNLVIFYTPPRSKKNIDIFSKYAIVKEVENITPPFKYLKNRPPSRFGEIIGHFEKVLSPNLFILDCDTIIKKDITELLVGDYDVAFRPDTMWEYVDKKKWEKIFNKYEKKSIPIPNKGFMIFKNNIHKKIQNESMNFMKLDIPEIFPNSYQKDQYALALALSGYKIKLFDKYVHAFHWHSEYNLDTYILHGRRKNRLIREILTVYWKIKHKKLYSEVKRRIQK
jgi:hypothetical protein